MFTDIIQVISFFVSLALYYFAPQGYSLQFCIICFSVFIISASFLIKERCKRNIITFELFFTIAFFFTNFVYPIFYYPINPYFSLFHLPFPEKYINSACALAAVGFSSFCVGVMKYKNATSEKIIPFIRKNALSRQMPYQPLAIVLLIFLIASLLPILASGIYDGNFGEGKIYKVLVDILIYYLVYEKFTENKNIKDVIVKNKLFFTLIIIYVGVITLIGNRGMLIRLALLAVLLYTSLFKKIKTWLIVVSFIAGAYLMTYIGQVRGGGTYDGFSEESSNIVLELGKDLTINNRSLYVLMEEYDVNGPTYGKTWLLNMLSVVPFAQSTFLSITGLKEYDINSAYLVTHLYFKDNTEKVIGLGTNLIGDIYICFGLIGVIFFMYLLGRVVSYTKTMGLNGNLWYFFVYSMLFIDCIILTRSTYLTSLRSIAWCWVLYYIAKSSKKRRITYNKQF